MLPSFPWFYSFFTSSLTKFLFSSLFIKILFFSNSNVISWNAGLNGKTRKWYSKKKTKWREMKIKQNEIVFLFFLLSFFFEKKNDARDAIRREMFISADRNRWLPSFVLELPSYFLILFVFVSFFPFRFVIVFIRLFLFLLSFAPLLLGIFHRFLFSFRFFFNFVFFFVCVCVCVCWNWKEKKRRKILLSLVIDDRPPKQSIIRAKLGKKKRVAIMKNNRRYQIYTWLPWKAVEPRKKSNKLQYNLKKAQ